MKINRYETRLDEIQEELELDGIEIGKVDNEYKAAFLCYQLLKGKAQESSVVIYLGLELELLGYEIIALGTSTRVVISPKSLLTGALKANASYIVTAHNHILSGTVEPSSADKEALDLIKNATQTMGIPLLGCFVVNEVREYYSMYSAYTGESMLLKERYGMIGKNKKKIRSRKRRLAMKIFEDSFYILLIQFVLVLVIAFVAKEAHLKFGWPIVAVFLMFLSLIFGTLKNFLLLEKYSKQDETYF